MVRGTAEFLSTGMAPHFIRSIPVNCFTDFPMIPLRRLLPAIVLGQGATGTAKADVAGDVKFAPAAVAPPTPHTG